MRFMYPHPIVWGWLLVWHSAPILMQGFPSISWGLYCLTDEQGSVVDRAWEKTRQEIPFPDFPSVSQKSYSPGLPGALEGTPTSVLPWSLAGTPKASQ